MTNIFYLMLICFYMSGISLEGYIGSWKPWLSPYKETAQQETWVFIPFKL